MHSNDGGEPTDLRGILLVGFLCTVGGILAGLIWLDRNPHLLGMMGIGGIVVTVLSIGPALVVESNPVKYFLAVFAGFGIGLLMVVFVTMQGG